MLAYYRAVRRAACRVAGAMVRSVEALHQGRVEHEPQLTDRMLGAVEETLRDFTTNGVLWTAKTLTDQAPGAQESKYGADFMGVLSIELPEFHVSKGFLAQAKLIRNGRIDDIEKLKAQCTKMLKLSPASFVFLYNFHGVSVLPALSVVGSRVDPLLLYKRSAQRFFEEHFQCFIGDRDIQSPTPETLIKLQHKYEARSALLIEGKRNGQ